MAVESSFHAGWLVAAIFSIATGALTIKQLIQRNPPLRDEFVSLEKHVLLKEKVDSLDEDVSQLGLRLDAKISDRDKELFALLRKNGEEIAGLKKGYDLLADNFAKLDYKLDQLLQQRNRP
jgi:hypothetical protein